MESYKETLIKKDVFWQIEGVKKIVFRQLNFVIVVISTLTKHNTLNFREKKSLNKLINFLIDIINKRMDYLLPEF